MLEGNGDVDNRKKRNNRNRKKKRSKGKKIAIGLASFIGIIILIGIILIVSFFSKVKNDGIIKATVPEPDQPVNILVLGMDIGDPNQVGNEAIKRTDTMMLLQYDPKAKDLDVVSVPRDTLVKEKGRNYKLNAAYQRGGEEKVKTIIEDMLSVKINYIFKIDYDAFRGLIDAVGGVDMEIERNMIYDDPSQDLHINFKKGAVEHLDGKKAEEFFRWRKNNDGSGFANGDLDRIENQHKFIQKVVEKCTQPLIVLKVPGIIDAIASNIQTNMSSAQMMSYGLDIVKVDPGTVKMWTAQGDLKDIAGQSYVVFNKDYNQELLKALHTGSGASASKVDKGKANVLVLNGTKINGLAGEVKTDLEAAGWKKVDAGNGDPTEKSIIKTDDKKIKEAINSDLSKIKKSDKKPNGTKYEQYDVVIVIGNDYKKLGE